jgi:hypothetical protein
MTASGAIPAIRSGKQQSGKQYRRIVAVIAWFPGFCRSDYACKAKAVPAHTLPRPPVNSRRQPSYTPLVIADGTRL